MVFGRPFPHVRVAVSHAVRVRWTTGAQALPQVGRRGLGPVVK
jgi:hypothetical protein